MDTTVYPETGACLNKYFLRSIKLVTNISDKLYGTEESREHESGAAFSFPPHDQVIQKM
jgi:hypothetical protein